MPAIVHLKEAVLGVDIPLGHIQIVGGVGIDLGDALFVPDHFDLGTELVDAVFAVQRGQWAPHQGNGGDQPRDEHDDENCCKRQRHAPHHRDTSHSRELTAPPPDSVESTRPKPPHWPISSSQEAMCRTIPMLAATAGTVSTSINHSVTKR